MQVLTQNQVDISSSIEKIFRVSVNFDLIWELLGGIGTTLEVSANFGKYWIISANLGPS